MGLLRRIFKFKDIISRFRNPKLLVILLGGIFFAFLGIIIFRNQISTFFQTDPGVAPVAYWNFNEGQGSTVNDSSGSSDGTLGSGSSAPTWISADQCISDKCLRFDGTNDYINIGNTLATSAGTISAWVKLDSSSNTYTIVSAADTATTTRYFHFRIGGNALSIAQRDNDTEDNFVSVQTLTVGTWNHIALTSDGSTYRIYVNGKESLLTTIGGSNTGDWLDNVTGADNLMIGVLRRTSDIYWLDGQLDEVKIYNYARSAAQIQADYTSRGTVRGTSAQFGDTDNGKKLSNGLIGYWKMDEVGVSGSNWTVVDSSGNNKNGTGVGNISVATTAAGKFGNAAFSDGNGDYVNFTNFVPVTGGNPRTITAWVNLTANNGVIASWGNYGTGENTELAINGNGRLVFNIYNAGSGEGPLVTNQGWTHVAVVCTGSTLNTCTLWKNGELALAMTSTTTINTQSNTSLKIGNNIGANDALTGKIDEVRIYNRALDTSEVQALYNFAPGPVAHWKMDEKQGSMIYDSSGYGFGGTINGTLGQTEWIPGKFGNAINFNGTINYINIYSSSFANTFNGSNGTISTWAKVPSTAIWGDSSINYLFKFGVDGNNSVHCYKPATNDDIQCIYTAGGTTEIFDFATTSTEWFYMTVSWDKSADSVKWYINGVLKETDTGIGTWAGSLASTTTLIGSNSTVVGSEWVGYIDDFKIYNYARTPSQIVSDMNAGHPAPGSPVGSALLHYKLDEGVGSTVNNYGNIGSSLNATLATGTSSPSWNNNGKYKKALSFDGTSDYIYAPDNSALDFNDQDFTISGWFYRDTATTDDMIIAKRNGNAAGNQGYMAWVDDTTDKIDFEISDATDEYDMLSSSTFTTPGWNHFVIVWDDDSVANTKIYVNGKDDNATHTGTQSNIGDLSTGNELHLGNVSDNVSSLNVDHFDGMIDEIKIYNSAFTPDQVKVEYNQGKAQVMGAGSTGVGGTSPSNSTSRAYCVPGDSATCSGPVGEWLMNEGVGNTLFDTSNNNLNANITTPPSPNWVQGKFGKALSFSGVHISNDENFGYGIPWVTDTTGSPLDVTNNLTFEAWIKPTSNAAYGDIISKVPNGYGSGYELANSSGTLRTILRTAGGNCDYSAGTLTTNVWQYVVSTYDGTYTKHYINGILQGTSTSCTTGATANDDQFQIGNRKNDGHFVGVIDEVRVYNYARSDGQIAWSHNLGKPVGYWKMEECTGTSIKDWGQSANSSYSGNTGTLTLGASGQTSAGTCSSGNTTEAWNNGTTGKIGASLNFDGSSDYVSITDNSLLDFEENADLSLSFWIKPSTTSTAKAIISKKTGNAATANGYMIHTFNGGTMGFYIADSTLANQVLTTTTSSLSTGVWTHVAIVYDAKTTPLIYFNGKRQTTTSSGGGTIGSMASLANGSPLVLGAESDFQLPFYGQLDEVKLFNYPLSPAQVKTEMAGGAVRFQ